MILVLVVLILLIPIAPLIDLSWLRLMISSKARMLGGLMLSTDDPSIEARLIST